jgi:hypothetical protein
MRTCTILLLTGTILSFVSVSCVMPAAAQDQAKTASPPAPAASSVPVPTATPPQKAPAPGAISRSTGHLFREGLAAGISADGVKKKSLSKANDKGLLMSTADGALPSAPLWGPTSADDIKSMLTLLVPNPHFEPANEIARRLLLTHTPWPENDDLKALRLQKMIEFGAGVQAGQLYSSWAPESPSLPLLKMGVTALILSGQPSVACLELGAQKSKWGQDKDPFFKTISNNCISYIKKGITNQSPLSPMDQTTGTITLVNTRANKHGPIRKREWCCAFTHKPRRGKHQKTGSIHTQPFTPTFPIKHEWSLPLFWDTFRSHPSPQMPRKRLLSEH